MPSGWRLTLVVDREVPLTAYAGVFAYTLALKILRDYDQLASERLHEQELPFKPLALSPLMSAKGNVPRVLKPEVKYSLELYIFHPEYEMIFHKAITERIAEIIHLPACNVAIVEAELMLRQWDDLRKEASELVESIMADRKFRLNFITPCQLGRLTRSRKRKPLFRLFPDPPSIIRSLARHWNAFSEIKLDADKIIEWSEEELFERAYRLRTKAIPLGEGRTTVGFIGWCEYEFRNIEKDIAQDLATLLKYAEIAGVGKHRTLGMGRVRTLNELRLHLNSQRSLNR